MMARDSFCVFILSHGRPYNQQTVFTLQRQGYTGPWFIVVDNEDKTVPEYIARYGEDRIVIIDKREIAKKFDVADNFPDRRAVMFARNACFGIARDLGYAYFLQLDDDYTSFSYRAQVGNELRQWAAGDVNPIFDTMLDLLDDTGASAVALAQGGDFIGGTNSGSWKKRVLRKVMNTFFCKTDRPFTFLGKINEDVSTYTTLATRGVLFLSTVYAMVNQIQTQAQAGGMTGGYLEGGTYVKSFYSVMMCPSAVKIFILNTPNPRIHHIVNWRNVAPKILCEDLRKARV